MCGILPHVPVKHPVKHWNNVTVQVAKDPSRHNIQSHFTCRPLNVITSEWFEYAVVNLY